MEYNKLNELQNMYNNGIKELIKLKETQNTLDWLLNYHIRNNQEDMINFVREKKIKVENEIYEWEELLKKVKIKLEIEKPNEIQIIEFNK